MKPDALNQAGLRRAALALHALDPVDRDWLLQRLPVARDALQRLLVELRELAMPADAEIIRVALNEAPAIAGVAVAQATSLCLALQTEPAALQCRLLALLGEAERRSVLALWPELQPFPAAVAEPCWTPAVREALLQSWREAVPAATRRPA